MISVYVECPFVLQLALKQEHANDCEWLLGKANPDALEIALPVVALVEPLYVQRGNFSERRRLADMWRAQANQLKRSNATTHRDAVAAMEDALVKAAPIDDQERLSIAATISALSKQCRMLPFRASCLQRRSRSSSALD